MLIRSLQSQVVLVLVVLIATLFTQLFLSRNNLTTLTKNHEIIAKEYDSVGLVYQLERDVIDLQRTLLIYKETASDSSVQRFYILMQRVESTLAIINDHFVVDDHLRFNEKIISNMSGHLTDYQDNFTSVIDGRSKRNELIDRIKQMIDNVKINSESQLKQQPTLELKLSLHITILSEYLNKYLHSPDAEYIERFKKEISEIKKVANKNPAFKKLIIKDINNISKTFIRLGHVTRGYIFLVNVVMAGSANEFLYQAKQLRQEVIKEKDALTEKTNVASKNIRAQDNIVAAMSVIIVLLIAWFLSKRILLPIKGITNVFRILSKGDEVDEIPSTDRKDEIGELAKAASVFHQKNKQTHDLLEKSQDMIAIQEVMNIQLEEERDKAEQATKSKSMFLANMSHEIRTPMNGIVGLVDLALKTELNEKQQNYLNRIAYSGQIMMNVINDILDFSKIEAGKMEIESIKFSINTVIENLISAMLVRVMEKSLDFKIHVSKSVPYQLIGDPLRISQILLNLCSNSIKFTEHGEVCVSVDYTDGQLLFTVTDTGIGMSQEQIDNIFTSFTQADGSTSRKYGGTGLGLTIVKQLVVLMGGDIQVVSQAGEGSSVKLKINSMSGTTEKATALAKIHNQKVNLIGSTDHKNEQDFDLHIQKHTAESFNKQLSNGPISEPLIVQLNNKAAINDYQEFINQWHDAHIKIGFLLETSDNPLKKQLQSQWDMPLLQQPYSPKQFKEFIYQLCAQDSQHQTEEGGDQAKEHKDNKYQGHVLLVEDNQINQLVAGDMLEGLGVSFDLAEDGQQAVECISIGKQYDLVFMDIQMPVMDGYTATQKIREMGKTDLIICGLSANSLKEDLDKADTVGMNDYLTKPLQMNDLEGVIKKYLPKQAQKQ